MQIKKAVYLKSSANFTQCPPPDKPEYAFIGRSNVGKSSFINMLTGQHKLAKTSSTPGKTQLINHFLINDSWYLVDLPGYGYARTAKTLRTQWNRMTMDYIGQRSNLYCLCVLIDSRLTPQKNRPQLSGHFRGARNTVCAGLHKKRQAEQPAYRTQRRGVSGKAVGKMGGGSPLLHNLRRHRQRARRVPGFC